MSEKCEHKNIKWIGSNFYEGESESWHVNFYRCEDCGVLKDE